METDRVRGQLLAPDRGWHGQRHRSGGRPLTITLECDHRDLALLHPSLVRAEEWHRGAVDPEEPLPLGSLAHLRASRELLAVSFHGHDRMCHEVAVPIWVRRRAAF